MWNFKISVEMESSALLGYSPILLGKFVAVAKELQGMNDCQEMNNRKYGHVNQSGFPSFCKGKKKKKSRCASKDHTLSDIKIYGNLMR